MQIQVGEYRDGDGRHVRIMGHAKCELIDGERVWWSLQGNWYTDSGLFVFTRMVDREPLRSERYTHPAVSKNIVQEA